jgi:N-acylneuraminate cytidylyltransferase
MPLSDLAVYIEIPARGGSKGVPRKALKPLGGRPLIAHTIAHALTVRGAAKVFVNTDDAEIRDVSRAHGAEVPFLRPPELATDTADLSKAHLYALEWYEKHENFVPDIVIIMSPTNPFRRKDLVNQSLEKAVGNEGIFNIASVAPAPVDPDGYFTMSGTEWERFHNDTSWNGKPKRFYQGSMSFNIVMNFRTGIPTGIVPFPLNPIEAIDIDTERDFDLAAMVLEKELYPFE